MVRRWPDRFEASPEWLRTFEARRQKILSSIKGDWGPYYGELPPLEGAEKFLADLREHLLANPLAETALPVETAAIVSTPALTMPRSRWRPLRRPP